MSTEHHRHRVGDNPDAESVQELKDEILGGPGSGDAEAYTDAEPVDAEPVDAEPVDAEPVDAEPVDAERTGAERTGAELVDAEGIDAERAGAESVAAEPADAEGGEPAPVLRATGLTLRTGEGPVFTGIDLSVAAGELLVLVGPAGSGRSCLLLALTGRMSGVTGDLMVDGYRLAGTAADGRRIRAATSVARIGTVVVPEPAFSVAESVIERALIDGADIAVARERFAEALRVLDSDPDAFGSTTIEELAALDRTVVTVALACVAPATVIVLDDLDRDLNRDDVADLTGRLGRLAASGPAIVATALDAPDTAGVTVVELAGSVSEGTVS